MWIGVLWAVLRVAMWITHVGGKFRHGLLEKSLKHREERSKHHHYTNPLFPGVGFSSAIVYALVSGPIGYGVFLCLLVPKNMSTP